MQVFFLFIFIYKKNLTCDSGGSFIPAPVEGRGGCAADGVGGNVEFVWNPHPSFRNGIRHNFNYPAPQGGRWRLAVFISFFVLLH
jgi:hypothetical protein